MNSDDLTRFLTQSLADRNLSSGEKSALSDWLSHNVTTDQDRGLARHVAFEVARTAIAERAVIDWIEGVMKSLAPIVSAPIEGRSHEKDRAYFSPGEHCLQTIIQRFEDCRRATDLCVFTITDDRISRAILDAHRRGVKLRILSDRDKSGDLGSDMRQFAEVGISVKLADVRGRNDPTVTGHMHHKFAIFDGERLINGSYNWTRGAANTNFENLIDTADLDLIEVFAEEFKRLWNRF